MDSEILAATSVLAAQLCLLWLAIALEEPRWARMPCGGLCGRLLAFGIWFTAAAALIGLATWTT